MKKLFSKKQNKQQESQERVLTEEEKLLEKYEKKERIEKCLETINNLIAVEAEEVKKYYELVEFDMKNGDIYGTALLSDSLRRHSVKLNELCYERVKLTKELERL